ncbi:MAG: TIGR02996 domain-containing protein [Zavarzinella sp.]|nr:TIGR02996 domain-containing protein [Zavarzinella sp.]
MVYADWLDERGDDPSAHKARFLRMTARLVTARSKLGRRYWEEKLRAAGPGLEAQWLAVVSKVPIEACSSLFAFRCPKRWEALHATDDPKVRHCDTCNKLVHFSSNIADARWHASRGECVALSVIVQRAPGDLGNPSRFEPGEMMVLGGLHPVTRTGAATPVQETRPDKARAHQSDGRLKRKHRSKRRRQKRAW